jgi:hypothetical protein
LLVVGAFEPLVTVVSVSPVPPGEVVELCADAVVVAEGLAG